MYVDRQGFWFETTAKQLSGAVGNLEIESLGVEAWIKFEQILDGANIIQIGPGNPGFQLEFSDIPEAILRVNNVPYKVPVTI